MARRRHWAVIYTGAGTNGNGSLIPFCYVSAVQYINIQRQALACTRETFQMCGACQCPILFMILFVYLLQLYASVIPPVYLTIFL